MRAHAIVWEGYLHDTRMRDGGESRVLSRPEEWWVTPCV